MFVHVKSPLFREKTTDVILNAKMIEGMDILKRNRNGKDCYQFMMFCSDMKGNEFYETLEGAQNRMAEVLQLCGETEERAKAIASDFFPEDKTQDRSKSDISDVIKRAILEAVAS